MRKIDYDSLIDEIKNEDNVRSFSYVIPSFDEIPVSDPDAQVFNAERYKKLLKNNIKNRVIEPVYRTEKNPIKRLFKAIVRKFTAIMYLNALEEQERHNEYSEEMMGMLLGKIESLDFENKVLRERLFSLEDQVERLNITIDKQEGEE